MGDAAEDSSSPCPGVFPSPNLSVPLWLDFQDAQLSEFIDSSVYKHLKTIDSGSRSNSLDHKRGDAL